MIMGFFLGCGITSIILKHKDEKPIFLRKGIYDHSFEISNLSGKYQVPVQFEVGELERTGSRSKIEVISVFPSQSKFSTDEDKERMKDLINHTWIQSNSVEWVADDVTEKRNQKIDQLLS